MQFSVIKRSSFFSCHQQTALWFLLTQSSRLFSAHSHLYALITNCHRCLTYFRTELSPRLRLQSPVYTVQFEREGGEQSPQGALCLTLKWRKHQCQSQQAGLCLWGRYQIAVSSTLPLWVFKSTSIWKDILIWDAVHNGLEMLQTAI